MDTYQYSPLATDLSEIRVLTLLPGDFESQTVVSISTMALAELGTVTPFPEALSYTWGSPDQRQEIFVSEEGGLTTLSVTINLAEALKYLRNRSKARLLWIDAICINQQDLEERSRQVRLMSHIYSKAARVVVWVGPQSGDSDMAIDCIEIIASHVEVNYVSSPQLYALTAELHWADVNELLRISRAEYDALYRFYSRSWFERLWVWQEVLLATDVLVLCGSRLITWIAVQTGVMCLGLKPGFGKAPDAAFNMARSPISTSLSLGVLLDVTKDASCLDPRDRIFALLSLLDQDMQSRIVPDYKKSTREVYKEVMLQLFEVNHQESPRLLSMVEVRNEIPESPSWVPRLDLPRLTSPFRYSYSALETLFLIKVLSLSTIEVTGVFVAQISRVEPINIGEDAAGPEIIEELKYLKDCIMPGQPQDQDLYPFIETLTANDVAERTYPSIAGRPSINDFPNFLEFVFEDDSNTRRRHYSPSVRRVLSTIREYGSGRALCTMADGRLCLSPMGTRSGDIVIVMLGCDSPLVLRPTTPDNLQYCVVGETFCHGVMDGEALLGPLPGDWRLVFRHESYGDYPAYWNSKLQLFSAEDPRLGDLPEGWSRSKKSHKYEELRTLFTRTVNGETSETWRDPRLTPDELRRSGVKLQTFELV